MTDRKDTEAAVARPRQQKAQLEALHAASLDLAAQLRSEDLYRTLLSHAIDLTDGEGGRVCLYRADEAALEPVATIGVEPASVQSSASGDLRPAEQAMETGSPLVVDCTVKQDGTRASAALAAIPIRQSGQFMGVLEVVASSPTAISKDSVDLLRQLTDLAAVAIQNAQRYEQTTLRAEHLAIINRVSHAVSRTLDLEDLTRVVYREIEAAFEVDAFFLALYDQENNELDYRLQVDGGTTIPRERKPLGNGLTASVVRNKEPLLIRNFEVERNQLPPAELWGSMRAPASWLGVPMLIGDRPLGVMCVQAYHPRAYGEIEQELLTTISEQVSIGVDNSRMYQETSRRLAQSQVLRELMVTAASTLDFDLVLERTLMALHSTMEVEPIGFAMPDHREEYLRLHPSQIGFPIDAEETALDLDHTICGRVFRTGEPLLIDDVQDAPQYHQVVAQTRSELAVPVGVHGEVAGVLDVESSQPNNFSDEDLDFYTTIASQLGVALENARLFEAERRQRQQTEALEEAAAVVSGTLDLDQVLDRILEQVESVVNGDAFNVVLIEEDGEAAVVRRRGYEMENWGVQSLSVYDYPLLQEMIEVQKPIIVSNTKADPRWVEE
ncbi:MAG: GAF domain-containing protein, partial [Anaerolineae bacterium]